MYISLARYLSPSLSPSLSLGFAGQVLQAKNKREMILVLPVGVTKIISRLFWLVLQAKTNVR
jgi:hypothetical protein